LAGEAANCLFFALLGGGIVLFPLGIVNKRRKAKPLLSILNDDMNGMPDENKLAC